MHTRVFISDTPEGQKVLVLFYEAACVFSNFYPANFKVNVNEKLDDNDKEKEKIVDFKCSEQYFMYQKALLADDEISAGYILQETNPMKMKLHGRRLKMSKKQIEQWSQKSRSVMYRACLEKFAQNDQLRLYLFRTHRMRLVEASPTDEIWGIGLNKSDKRAENPETWRGTNWLGEVLDMVREELWKREEFKADREKVLEETLEVRCALLENF